MKLLLSFMLPFLMANLLNSLYNTVDTIIIGQFGGSSGIVAVNTSGKLLHMFTNISLALAGGGQVLISQMIGAKRERDINAAIGTMLTEMFGLSVFFAIVMVALSDWLVGLLNTPDASYAQALSYLRITMAGMPLLFGYSAISSVLRGMGDSKHPLIFILIATVVNIIGDLILIVAFEMAATGAAIATVVGQGVSLVFSLVFLYRKKSEFGFDFKWKSFALDWPKLGIMLRLGLPLALRSCFINFTQLALLRYVNLCGIAESAAYAIGDKIYHLVNNFTNSIKQAAGSMIGQNIGASRTDRVREIVRKSFLICLIAAILISVPSVLFPRAIFGLFTTDEAVLSYAKGFMLICALIYFLSAWLGPYDAVITGTGNAKLSFIAGLMDGVVFRISFSILFAYVFNWGILGFFMGDALARISFVIFGGPYYHTGAWMRKKKLV